MPIAAHAVAAACAKTGLISLLLFVLFALPRPSSSPGVLGRFRMHSSYCLEDVINFSWITEVFVTKVMEDALNIFDEPGSNQHIDVGGARGASIHFALGGSIGKLGFCLL